MNDPGIFVDGYKDAKAKLFMRGIQFGLPNCIKKFVIVITRFYCLMINYNVSSNFV